MLTTEREWDFAPVFVFMFLGFFIAVIVINVVFNRKR